MKAHVHTHTTYKFTCMRAIYFLFVSLYFCVCFYNRHTLIFKHLLLFSNMGEGLGKDAQCCIKLGFAPFLVIFFPFYIQLESKYGSREGFIPSETKRRKTGNREDRTAKGHSQPMPKTRSIPRLSGEGGSSWQPNMESCVACHHGNPKNITLKWKGPDMKASILYKSSYKNMGQKWIIVQIPSAVGMPGEDPNWLKR